MRRILYISGTRADYGLMASTLRLLNNRADCELGVIATGMHLMPGFGQTIGEIEQDGLTILARIALPVETSTGAGMAKAIGFMVSAFTEVLEREAPDAVLLLGDRGEMLAGAIAASHLNIPVVHIHGGERSGTIDEPVRHAISKLSHWHCVATEQSRERLIRMGELETHIRVTGAPGLDGLTQTPRLGRVELCAEQGLDPARPLALLVFHPVVQEAAKAGPQTQALLEQVFETGLQVLALKPNSDAGGKAVLQVLEAQAAHPDLRLVTHMRRPTFVGWMAVADLMIGNSSSGIIEAASFGTPVINVGLRQNLRERNANVIDCDASTSGLAEALHRWRAGPQRFPAANVYGDGKAGERIVDLLTTMPLDASILMKANAY